MINAHDRLPHGNLNTGRQSISKLKMLRRRKREAPPPAPQA
jgi:hypothetical protein